MLCICEERNWDWISNGYNLLGDALFAEHWLPITEVMHQSAPPLHKVNKEHERKTEIESVHLVSSSRVRNKFVACDICLLLWMAIVWQRYLHRNSVCLWLLLGMMDVDEFLINWYWIWSQSRLGDTAIVVRRLAIRYPTFNAKVKSDNEPRIALHLF